MAAPTPPHPARPAGVMGSPGCLAQALCSRPESGPFIHAFLHPSLTHQRPGRLGSNGTAQGRSLAALSQEQCNIIASPGRSLGSDAGNASLPRARRVGVPIPPPRPSQCLLALVRELLP